MPDILIDGNFSGPVTNNDQRWEFPFRKNGDRVTAFFEQDYWQKEATFTPQELGNPHPDRPDFYLIKESKPVPIGANLLDFTRTYSRIPVTQTVYSAMRFTKPSLASFGTAQTNSYEMGVAVLANAYTYLGYFWDGTYNRVYGPATVTTSADSGADTTLTWTAHGITTQRFYVKGTRAGITGTSYTVFPSGTYTVVDADTITLTGVNYGTTAIEAGKYLRDYTSGPDSVSTRVLSKFYLPGVTTGITTGADIPIPNPLVNDAAFLAAVVSTLSGWLNYDTNQLVQWMDSPIYQLDTVEINMGDL